VLFSSDSHPRSEEFLYALFPEGECCLTPQTLFSSSVVSALSPSLSGKRFPTEEAVPSLFPGSGPPVDGLFLPRSPLCLFSIRCRLFLLLRLHRPCGKTHSFSPSSAAPRFPFTPPGFFSVFARRRRFIGRAKNPPLPRLWLREIVFPPCDPLFSQLSGVVGDWFFPSPLSPFFPPCRAFVFSYVQRLFSPLNTRPLGLYLEIKGDAPLFCRERGFFFLKRCCLLFPGTSL